MYFKKSFRCNDAKFLYYVNINTWLICQGKRDVTCVLRPPPGLKTDVENDIFGMNKIVASFVTKNITMIPSLYTIKQ